MKEQRVKEDCGQAMEGRQHGEGCSFICQALSSSLLDATNILGSCVVGTALWEGQPGGEVRGDLIRPVRRPFWSWGLNKEGAEDEGEGDVVGGGGSCDLLE